MEWDAELYGELLSTGGGKERMARRGLQSFAPIAWRAYNPSKSSHLHGFWHYLHEFSC